MKQESSMLKTLRLALTALVIAGPALAQFAPPPDALWQGLPLETRIGMQVDLIAAGYLTRVPNVDLNDDIVNAASRYQGTHGGPVTGVLDPKQANDLRRVAAVPMAAWGFRTVIHPRSRRSLLVPMGLGLVPSIDGDVVSFDRADDRVRIKFGFHQGMSLEQAHQKLLTSTLAGRVIAYDVLRPDFFAVLAFQDGRSVFYRFHVDGAGLTGFMVSWRTVDDDIRGDRLSTLMSASLYASMTSAPFPFAPPLRD
jgi:hypothetical protein